MSRQYETVKACILCDSREIETFSFRLSLNRCRGCGLIFDNPRPTTYAIERFYSKGGKYGSFVDSERERVPAVWNKVLKRIRRFKPRGRLLDIGAGTGDFLSLAQKYYNVSGTEISSEGIGIARTRYGIEIKKGEIENIDFGGERFDVITMCQVLEHFPYPGRTLGRCLELLAPGGILYIGVPNEAPYSLRMTAPALFSVAGVKRFKSVSPGGWRKIDLDAMNEIHLSHFTEAVLKRGLRKAGYEIEAGGPDFIDLFMYMRGPVQILRYFLYGTSLAARFLTGLDTYNCMWMIAGNKSAEN